MFFQDKTRNIYLAILVVASCFVFFWNLGGASLAEWDEGIYALISHNIVETGNLNLTWDGQNNFWEKPPAGYWLEALAIKIFGLSEFSVRFFSSIFLLLSIILVYLLAEKIFKNKHLSFISAVVVLLSPALLHQHMARSGDLEAYLLFFTLASLYFLKLAEEKPKLLWLSGAMVGLGIMFRGSSGVLVIGVCVAYLILSGVWRRFNWKNYLGYLTAILVVVLPWHIYQLIIFGREFWEVYFMQHFLSRISEPIQSHTGRWDHYFQYFRLTNGIWIIPCYLGMFYGAIQILVYKNQKWLLPLLWFWVIMLPLAIMQTKLYWYGIILIPPFFYLGVAYLYEIIQKNKRPWLWLTNGTLIFCWLFISKLDVFHFGIRERWYFLAGVLVASAILSLIIIQKDKILFWQKFNSLFLIIFLLGFGLKIIQVDYKFINNSNQASIEILANKIADLKIENTKIATDETFEWFNGWPLPSAQFYVERLGKNKLDYQTEPTKIGEYDYLISNKDLDYISITQVNELRLYKIE
ncbi:MAG: glycosyltransferase family 39 protein [Patescibacteria group bacterium]